MKDDLLEKALKYAKHDDYHVTRRIITDLCNEIERLRELNKDRPNKGSTKRKSTT